MEVLKSKIILGTVQFGLPYGINNKTGIPSDKEVSDILDYCRVNSIQTIDTAVSYGSSIEKIGKYQRSRNYCFDIINKISFDSKNSLLEQINNSLTLLGIPAFETLLIHSFDDYYNRLIRSDELFEMKQNGKIKKIGVSIYSNDQLQKVIDDKSIEVIQLPFNILDNALKREKHLLDAKSAGKEIHARSVFLQGLFFINHGDFPKKLFPLLKYIDHAKSISDNNDISIESLALNYVLSKPYIDKVLIGIDSLAQLVSNIGSISNKINIDVFESVDAININDINLLNPVNWK